MRAPVDPFACCGEVSEPDSDQRRTEWICCALCFWILCPLIACMYGYNACQKYHFRHTEAKHHNRQLTEASVPALPKRRPRSLSLTPSGSQPSLSRNPLVPIPPMLYGQRPQAGKLDDQACVLFFKLSPELRQMIYREVLSGNDFAIMRIRSCPETKEGIANGKAKPGKLSHLKYSAETEQQQQSIRHPTWLRRYFGIVGIRPAPLNADFEPNVLGEELLPLVKSCRRMYLETIDLLYSSNTFHFYHEDDFLAFTSAILPQRMNEITSIHLHFFPDYYTILSNPKISTVISAMKNLRRLEISFTTILGRRHSTWFSTTNERALVRKLQDLGGDVPIKLWLGLPSDQQLAIVESPQLPSNNVRSKDFKSSEERTAAGSDKQHNVHFGSGHGHRDLAEINGSETPAFVDNPPEGQLSDQGTSLPRKVTTYPGLLVENEHILVLFSPRNAPETELLFRTHPRSQLLQHWTVRRRSVRTSSYIYESQPRCNIGPARVSKVVWDTDGPPLLYLIIGLEEEEST